MNLKMFFGFVLATLLLLSCGEQEAGKKDLAKPTDLYDKVAYYQGFRNGLMMRFAKQKDSIKIDLDYYFRGIRDGLDSNLALMNYSEMDSVESKFEQEMAKKEVARQAVAEKENAKVAEMNKTLGPKFLEENKTKPGVVTTPTGLQYKILKKANGKKPVQNEFVKFHMVFKLVDGRVVDDTYKKGEPVIVPMGRSIPGWTEALSLMPVGSKWEVVIPPALGFGEAGSGQVIPPNSVLICEIELLDIVTETEFQKFMQETMKRQQGMQGGQAGQGGPGGPGAPSPR